MKQGDIEFHEQSGAILNAIANEGLRIARSNNWRGLVIEIATTDRIKGGFPRNLRCFLKSTDATREIDEPTAALLNAANQLQDLFVSVGTPFLEATIDWIDGDTPGTARRRCSYRYE